jgi:hypothetical protein
MKAGIEETQVVEARVDGIEDTEAYRLGSISRNGVTLPLTQFTSP